MDPRERPHQSQYGRRRSGSQPRPPHYGQQQHPAGGPSQYRGRGVSTGQGAFATPSGAWPPRDYSSDLRDAQGAPPPSQGQYMHGRPLHPAHGVRHEETGDETYEPTAAQLEAAMLLQTRPQGRDQYMYPEGLFLLRNTAPEWGGGIWRLPIQNIDPLIVAEAQLRDRWRWHQRVAHSQTDDAVTKEDLIEGRKALCACGKIMTGPLPRSEWPPEDHVVAQWRRSPPQAQPPRQPQFETPRVLLQRPSGGPAVRTPHPSDKPPQSSPDLPPTPIASLAVTVPPAHPKPALSGIRVSPDLASAFTSPSPRTAAELPTPPTLAPPAPRPHPAHKTTPLYDEAKTPPRPQQEHARPASDQPGSSARTPTPPRKVRHASFREEGGVDLSALAQLDGKYRRPQAEPLIPLEAIPVGARLSPAPVVSGGSAVAPQPLEPIHPADLLKPSVEPKVDGSQDIGSNSSSLSDLDLLSEPDEGDVESSDFYHSPVALAPVDLPTHQSSSESGAGNGLFTPVALELPAPVLPVAPFKPTESRSAHVNQWKKGPPPQLMTSVADTTANTKPASSRALDLGSVDDNEPKAPELSAQQSSESTGWQEVVHHKGKNKGAKGKNTRVSPVPSPVNIAPLLLSREPVAPRDTPFTSDRAPEAAAPYSAAVLAPIHIVEPSSAVGDPHPVLPPVVTPSMSHSSASSAGSTKGGRHHDRGSSSRTQWVPKGSRTHERSGSTTSVGSAAKGEYREGSGRSKSPAEDRSQGPPLARTKGAQETGERPDYTASDEGTEGSHRQEGGRGRKRGMGKRGRGGRAASAQHGPFLAPSFSAGGDESQHRDAITEANAT